jgi:uncharacterized membrane protein
MSTATRRALILILAVAGLAAAATSTYVHYRLLTVPDFTSFCDVNATVSCAQAYLSPYGELGGVPVAIFGAVYFAAVLAIAALGWPAKAPAPPAAPSYILALSIPALAFVAYLAYAAFVVLKAFCILCAISYVSVLGITIVAWRTPRVPLGDLPGRASRDLVGGPQPRRAADRDRAGGRHRGRSEGVSEGQRSACSCRDRRHHAGRVGCRA